MFLSGEMGDCDVGEQRKANDVYGSSGLFLEFKFKMDGGQFGHGVKLMP